MKLPIKLQVEPTEDFRAEMRILSDDSRMALEDARDDMTRAASRLGVHLAIVAVALVVVAVVIHAAVERKAVA